MVFIFTYYLVIMLLSPFPLVSPRGCDTTQVISSHITAKLCKLGRAHGAAFQGVKSILSLAIIINQSTTDNMKNKPIVSH